MAVDVVGLDVLVVSVMLMEPKGVLVDVSLNALKRLPPVGIGFVTLKGLWLVEVVASVPNATLGVEEDVPNPEKPVALCEAYSVDVVGVLKRELVVVEDEGCTAALEIPVAVVLGIWVLRGEGFVPNSPPVGEENKDSALPNEKGDEVDSKVSLFKETAFMPEGLLAAGALELLLLELSSFKSKKPFADEALDVVLLKEPNPEEPVMLGDVPLDAPLFVAVPKGLPVELAFQM